MHLTHPKEAIYVVYHGYFEDESIVFRHGMNGIFSIANKIVVEEGNLVACDKVDFPLSSLDVLLIGEVVDATALQFYEEASFLDLHYDLYQFRNQLSQHFVDALAGGLKKRNFRFNLSCPTEHFCALQRPTRSHSSGQMLTHDSVFNPLFPYAPSQVR